MIMSDNDTGNNDSHHGNDCNKKSNNSDTNNINRRFTYQVGHWPRPMQNVRLSSSRREKFRVQEFGVRRHQEMNMKNGRALYHSVKLCLDVAE